MSELEVHNPQNEVSTFTDSPNGTDLAAWVADLGNAFTLADKICRTPFAPRDFQGKPEAAAVAILHGKSLGLDPLASMSSIFVVSGRPGLYSKAMHAIVMAAGHQVWVESESDQEVVVKGKRRGQEAITTSRWTPERAKKAGYDSNKKYLTEPIAMLRARAIGDVCRVVAPDVLSGLAYNEADVAIMEDLGETVTTTVEPEKPKTTIKRKTNSAPAPDLPAAVKDAPRGEEEPPSDEADAREATGEICTPEQWTHLTVALKAAGYGTKQQMRNAVEGFLGRSTNGPEDLTVDEVERMLVHFPNLNQAAADETATADEQWLARA